MKPRAAVQKRCRMKDEAHPKTSFFGVSSPESEDDESCGKKCAEHTTYNTTRLRRILSEDGAAWNETHPIGVRRAVADAVQLRQRL